MRTTNSLCKELAPVEAVVARAKKPEEVEANMAGEIILGDRLCVKDATMEWVKLKRIVESCEGAGVDGRVAEGVRDIWSVRPKFYRFTGDVRGVS